MNCVFKPYGPIVDGKQRCICIRCGKRTAMITLRSPCGKRRRTCKSQAKEPEIKPLPSFGEQVKNFSIAAITHFLGGSPTCTQAEIDARRLSCLQCTEFRPVDNRCAACGCPATQSHEKYVNKLAWADQYCPVGRWVRRGERVGPLDPQYQRPEVELIQLGVMDEIREIEERLET